MRIFSLISILVTALLVAWLSVYSMRSLTGGSGHLQPNPSTPGQTSTQTQHSPVDMANELASMDRARQQQMEELMR